MSVGPWTFAIAKCIEAYRLPAVDLALQPGRCTWRRRRELLDYFPDDSKFPNSRVNVPILQLHYLDACNGIMATKKREIVSQKEEKKSTTVTLERRPLHRAWL